MAIAQPASQPDTAIVNRIDTLPSGELMLVQEVRVSASPHRVWDAFTVEEEWVRWVAPVVDMDFRINGTIRSHYNPGASIGDEGTIVLHVLNYIPGKQITLQAEMGPGFPEPIRAEEKNLYSIFTFNDSPNAGTLVTLYGIGYKKDPQWTQLLEFFIQGNEMTLSNLKTYLEQ